LLRSARHGVRSAGYDSFKVLLADDNRERSDTVSRRLSEAGVLHIVTLAPGQRLVEAVEAEAPDVVMVDPILLMFGEVVRIALINDRDVAAGYDLAGFTTRHCPATISST
jgi:AmiR/NasT family two-component response regulator